MHVIRHVCTTSESGHGPLASGLYSILLSRSLQARGRRVGTTGRMPMCTAELTKVKIRSRDVRTGRPPDISRPPCDDQLILGSRRSSADAMTIEYGNANSVDHTFGEAALALV